MIGYSLISGDEEVSKMFTPYIWNEHGISNLFENKFKNKIYGKDLKLLLIMYHIEGKFSSDSPKSYKIGNYSSKNKDIRVELPVTRELFHEKNEFERREFIVDSTIQSIKLIKDKLDKKKLQINFGELLSDIILVSNDYLKYQKSYN